MQGIILLDRWSIEFSESLTSTYTNPSKEICSHSEILTYVDLLSSSSGAFKTFNSTFVIGFSASLSSSDWLSHQFCPLHYHTPPPTLEQFCAYTQNMEICQSHYLHLHCRHHSWHHHRHLALADTASFKQMNIFVE